VADNYTELYYHLVWATKNREPYLNDFVAEAVFEFINHLCHGIGVEIAALNGMPDHVHLACKIPTSLSVASVMNDVKGKSSHYINHLEGRQEFLAWQPGYGALTFSKRDLNRVVKYIQNQQQHHASGNIFAKLEIVNGHVAS
jgi:putative transposase